MADKEKEEEEYPSNAQTVGPKKNYADKKSAGSAKKQSAKKQAAKKVDAKKEVTKVVVGEVKKRKTPLGERIKNSIIAAELPGVGKYIMSEVLLPALRNLIFDTATKGVERVVYGEQTARRRGSYSAGGPTRVNYSNPLSPRDPRVSRPYLPDQPNVPRGTRAHVVGDIVVASREDGELVLERMGDIIDKYEVASVADLYDLLGMPTSYIDNNWGWIDLAYSDVRQVREGYLLTLPTPEPLSTK